ncbi:hypothetical protein MMC24_001507 [Lignoscripta atroalba]|nr:hypothetical protein [Lignoscripta atroalba]
MSSPRPSSPINPPQSVGSSTARPSSPTPPGGPKTAIRRKAAADRADKVANARPTSTRAAGAGGSSSTMLRLYTDESPGLKVDPVVILVLSLGFIFSVVALHKHHRKTTYAKYKASNRGSVAAGSGLRNLIQGPPTPSAFINSPMKILHPKEDIRSDSFAICTPFSRRGIDDLQSTPAEAVTRSLYHFTTLGKVTRLTSENGHGTRTPHTSMPEGQRKIGQSGAQDAPKAELEVPK